MIDTAYTPTPFPASSSLFPGQIRFQPRVKRQPAPQPRVDPRRQTASCETPVPPRPVPRRATRYFLLGLVLMGALVQASHWLPIEGLELLFVRGVLLFSATISFLASADAGARSAFA